MLSIVDVVDDFISDANLTEVDKLRPAKPHDERYRKVIKAGDSSGNSQTINLNIQKAGAKNVRVHGE